MKKFNAFQELELEFPVNDNINQSFEYEMWMRYQDYLNDVNDGYPYDK